MFSSFNALLAKLAKRYTWCSLMKIVDIFFINLQEQWLKQRIGLEQRYPHEIVPLSSFSWNFYKPLMQGYFITFLGCDKLITETVIRVVDEKIKLLKLQSIACDSFTFLFSLLCGWSVHRKLNDCRWRPKGVNLFLFFFFFCFVLFCLFDFSLNYFWSFGFWRLHKTDWWEKMFYSACLN